MSNTTFPSGSAEAFAPDVAAQVRASTNRADRLRAFIRGHLPPGIDVEVVLTPAVETAAVLHADIDALVGSDATDLERKHAAQLLDHIDAEYLVLVTTAPAPLDRIPLNDQLTADHAHQFGLAFHELLHILKTAIGPIGELLDAEVDSEYHQQVHDLINLVEDGAIEQEAIEGANFSDNAEVRLALTRRIHSQTPDDIPDGEQVRFTFWDAVTSALYEWSIYPTGIIDVLLNSDDDRISFASDVHADAFDAVHDSLRALARDALAIHSADRDDITNTHDKTASVQRARLVVETWQSAILPVLQSLDESVAQPSTPGGRGETGENSEPSSSNAGPLAGGTGGDEDARSLLDRNATADPHQDVLDQPSVTPDPEDDLEDIPQPEARDESSRSASAASSSDTDDEESSLVEEPDSEAQALARSIERTEAQSASSDGRDTSIDVEMDTERGDRHQSTIGEFDAGGTPNVDPDEGTTDTDENIPSDHPSSESPATSIPPTEEPARSADPEPAHVELPGNDSAEENDAYEQALEPDRAAAHDEADREGIDTDALERELDGLVRHVEQDDADGEQAVSGSAGGPGQLDELELVPINDEPASPGVWADIEDGAANVAGTLEKQLQLERRRGTRTGLTAGAYDTTAGHRLAIGDPRVCKVDTPGREKRYALVLVLDRSGSMRNGTPPKIEVATQALARFAVAAEELGIEVAIVDFLDSHARLMKPFSVKTRHVQTTLLETECGGGTPLADALGLAARLVETHRDEPLIVAVTDGEPSNVDEVIEQIRTAHVPVCSLTIATDTPSGQLSRKASELSRYYEREATVHDGERLDDRLDQFASLLTGL